MLSIRCRRIITTVLFLSTNPNPKVCLHTRLITKYLCKAGLYAKAEKCKFHSESVEYLGYILSPFGLTMSNDKVKIIQDWLEPKKIKDIQSFLDFANFYHQFIFNYLDIIILLTHLMSELLKVDLIFYFSFSFLFYFLFHFRSIFYF